MAARLFLPAGCQCTMLAARNSPSLSLGVQFSPTASVAMAHPRLAGAIRAASEEASASSVAPVTLDIPEAEPATSTSLVASVPEIVTLEGAAGLAQMNHYKILKVPFGSDAMDIIRAYKDRREELSSAQTAENEAATNERLRLLRESFEILTSDEERKVYDWALTRHYTQSTDNYIWPYETDITQRQISDDPLPFERSIDEEGTRRLGLFLLGWVIVSMIFSATMKTWIPYPHYADFVQAGG